jgi:hypothetical protein
VNVVFLGPSLSRTEARSLFRGADLRPPARQGDVFRAIEDGAHTIALIDGVFEASPSVWHHELIAAHESGLRVLGASSMGALRAAELPEVVTPLGEIATRFVKGEWNDDAHVALLHGDEASGFRALSVPWVNVWATVQQAVKRKRLTPKEGREVCAAAESIFYQSRTWARIVRALPWPERRLAVVRHVFETSVVDLKAADARVCLRWLARRPGHVPKPVRASTFSSFVRRARLPPAVASAPWEAGVRVLLLAEFARQAGIEPPAHLVKRHRDRLRTGAPDQRERWAEALALDDLVLSAPERFVSDGPSQQEGAALTAAMK